MLAFLAVTFGLFSVVFYFGYQFGRWKLTREIRQYLDENVPKEGDESD